MTGRNGGFIPDGYERKCNPVTKPKKAVGRRREWIAADDLAEPPNETMTALINMKNDGHSWRSLADEINLGKSDGQRVSHSLVRRVALGQCKSPRIDYALGIREAPPPVEVTPCPDCGAIHKQRKACKETPKNGKVRFSVWLTEDERDIARAITDAHPDGRAAGFLEKLGVKR